MPNINSEQEQVLETFVRGMIVDKGLLEEDKKQNGKIYQDLRQQLEEVLERSMIDALSDEKALELDKLLDENPTDEKIEQFFDNAGVDYAVAMGKAMANFRKEYLGEAGSTNDEVSNNIIKAVESRPKGVPMQGAVSEVPGASDVEGVAQESAAMTEEA